MNCFKRRNVCAKSGSNSNAYTIPLLENRKIILPTESSEIIIGKSLYTKIVQRDMRNNQVQSRDLLGNVCKTSNIGTLVKILRVEKNMNSKLVRLELVGVKRFEIIHTCNHHVFVSNFNDQKDEPIDMEADSLDSIEIEAFKNVKVIEKLSKMKLPMNFSKYGPLQTHYESASIQQKNEENNRQEMFSFVIASLLDDLDVDVKQSVLESQDTKKRLKWLNVFALEPYINILKLMRSKI